MPPTDEEAYQKNVKEQYEALGRFVESFELMVYEVRETIITISGQDYNARVLFETMLHHSSLTAKPLFDILRAVVAEILENTLTGQEERKNGIHDRDGPMWKESGGQPVEITLAERDSLFGAMTTIASEYDTLINRRNDLLHGTWFIGFTHSDNPDSAEFLIRRYKTSSKGLKKVEGLPKNADELRTLAFRCQELRDWLGRVEQIFQRDLKVTDVFKFKDGEWHMDDPPGTMRTLPRR